MSNIVKKTFEDLRGGLNTVLDRVQLETHEGPLSTPDCLNVLGRSGGIETRPGSAAYLDLGAPYRLYTVVAIEPWHPLDPPSGSDDDVDDAHDIVIIINPPIDTDPPIILDEDPPVPTEPLTHLLIRKSSPANAATANLPVTLVWQVITATIAFDESLPISYTADAVTPVSYAWAVSTNSGMTAIVDSGTVSHPTVSVSPSGLTAGITYYWQITAAYADGFSYVADAGVVRSFVAGAVATCEYCTGGPGTTPGTFLFNTTDFSKTIVTNPVLPNYTETLYYLTGIPNAILSQVDGQPCRWGGNEVAPVCYLRRVVRVSPTQIDPIWAVTADDTWPLAATLFRISTTQWLMSIELYGGGDVLYFVTVPTTGCIAAAFSGDLIDLITDAIITDAFAVTITPQ